MNASVLKLESELEKSETRKKVECYQSLNLLSLINKIVRNTSIDNCFNSLTAIYESSITVAHTLEKHDKRKQAANAYYVAGMTAATLYFQHCEWIYSAKSVHALRNYMIKTSHQPFREKKAQKTIKSISNHT